MQERWARMREEINNIHQLKDVARINAEKRVIVVGHSILFLDAFDFSPVACFYP